MISDILGKPINKGDFVVYHNLIYEVVFVPKDNGKKIWSRNTYFSIEEK